MKAQLLITKRNIKMQQLTFIHANSQKAWLEGSLFIPEKENLWYLQ